MELQRFGPAQPPERTMAMIRFSESDGKVPGPLNETHLVKRSLLYFDAIPNCACKLLFVTGVTRH